MLAYFLPRNSDSSSTKIEVKMPMKTNITVAALAFLTGCQTVATPPTQTATVNNPLSGITIENSVSFKTIPPSHPAAIGNRYMMGDLWSKHDLNGDGLIDYLYTGVMEPDNPNIGNSVDTGDACGKGRCKGTMPLPSLFLADFEGQFILSDGKFIDNRKSPGMSLARQNLVADFNGDGILDLYVADTGLGTHSGFRDSYFLSQTNGTWLESSKSHLSDSNFVAFDHGATTGDIDADGDMDIVLTTLEKKLVCWFNDGRGFMSKKVCGSHFTFAIELGDMDNDGDLDIVSGGAELTGSKPVILYNNGEGKFSKKTQLPTVGSEFGGAPEVALNDLDNDGDLDIVVSRVGHLYVGTGVQIIKNNNSNFDENQFIVIVDKPKGYEPTTEGNPHNNFIQNFSFDDVNDDGTTDIIFSGENKPTHGGALLNNGNFNFTLVKPNEDNNPVTILSTMLFKGTADSWLETQGIQFTPELGGAKLLGKPIELGSIQGVIEGLSEVSRSENGLIFVAHVKTQNGYMKISMCAEYYPEYTFIGTRVGFDTQTGFGGVSSLRKYGKGYCLNEKGFVGFWEADKDSMPAVLQDLLQEIDKKREDIYAIN